MSEKRNERKTYRGRVVSDKMDKTITVEIKTTKMHPTYGKRIKSTKKFMTRDENNEAKINDIVEIMETRPLSKNVHFRLVGVVEKSVII